MSPIRGRLWAYRSMANRAGKLSSLLPLAEPAMALYRFLFAPVLLAVAAFQGGGPTQGAGERRAAQPQAIRVEAAPAPRPAPARDRVAPPPHRPQLARAPSGR